MLGWLIEIRNFFLALTLAWVGVSLATEEPAKVEKPAKFTPVAEATVSGKCASARRH